MRKLVVKPGYYSYIKRKYVIFSERVQVPGFKFVKSINYTPKKVFFQEYELNALMDLGVEIEVRAIR